MTNCSPMFSKLSLSIGGLSILAIGGFTDEALAQDSQADIAKKLSNPIAAMISVPIQANYDQNIGATEKGEKYLVNIQPVIPFSLNEDWNIVSRTILPLVQLNDVPPGNDDSGVGDVLQTVFFSPNAATATGWIWGAGPVLLLDTATDDNLGAEKWAAGPSMVALKQDNGWTYGALVNQLWSYAGDSEREDISAAFVQPFLSFTTARFTTYTVNTESTYNFKSDEWAVPINLMISQLFKIGNQPMSIQIGARYWAESPDGAAEGWGARLAYTLVIPK